MTFSKAKEVGAETIFSSNWRFGPLPGLGRNYTTRNDLQLWILHLVLCLTVISGQSGWVPCHLRDLPVTGHLLLDRMWPKGLSEKVDFGLSQAVGWSRQEKSAKHRVLDHVRSVSPCQSVCVRPSNTSPLIEVLSFAVQAFGRESGKAGAGQWVRRGYRHMMLLLVELFIIYLYIYMGCQGRLLPTF